MSSRLSPTGAGSSLALFALLALGAPTLNAQPPRATAKPAKQKVRLSAVIAGFLADSGVRTRGLPWTTGDELAIKWASAKPVANPEEWSRKKGITMIRSGTFTGTVGDSVALDMTITVSGIETGLSRVIVGIPSMEVTYKNGSGFFANRETVEKAMKDEGLTLQPLKCSREKESASQGNLVDAVKAPGKTASGLWWLWESPQQKPTLMLTILYRRTDMAEVECYSG